MTLSFSPSILCFCYYHCTAAIIRKLTTQPQLLEGNLDEDKLQKALRFAVCAGIISQWTKGAIDGFPSESAAQNLTEQVYPPSMVLNKI